MNSLAINPWSGSLQLINKSNTNPAISVQEEGDIDCIANQVYIAQGKDILHFSLPKQPKQLDWIKIFGKEESGWVLHIPEGQNVVCQSSMRILDCKNTMVSNMHAFDFVHAIYLGNNWFIENKSNTVGIL